MQSFDQSNKTSHASIYLAWTRSALTLKANLNGCKHNMGNIPW